MRAIIATQDLPHHNTKATPLSDRLTLINTPTPEPGPTQVRIKIRATAVNPADVLQSKGAYPPPPGATHILGLECAGTIDKIGSQVTTLPGCEWITHGAPAAALLEGGAYADYAIVDARQTLPLPNLPTPTESDPSSDPTLDPMIQTMGLIESAAASWMILENVAKLKSEPKPTVLIHGASGGVGTIATQLAKSWGCRVYATAGTPQRCARVETLGAHKCFNYHDNWPALLKQTEPRGMCAIMDVLGGGGLTHNVNALARGGHLAILGLLTGTKGELNLGTLLSKNASITATTLRSQTPENKAEIMRHLRKAVWPLVETGEIKPVIGKILPFEEMATAHALLAGKGENVFGKIVVTL
ncbi:MAG: NAD(P)H-quinone oxidoreductase [Actinomycetaceae bacterium]|nr:NAD(P)H-quinone oxidoreductase [Actinomycetaceae bacterium]